MRRIRPADLRSQLVTTVEEISALTRPDHPDDWTDWTRTQSTPSACWRRTRCRRSATVIPGTAMSLAPLAYTLFQRQMRHDPATCTGWGATGSSCPAAMQPDALHPAVSGRLRFGTSDIEALRTWGSKTPATPSSATPRPWRSPPARWARGWRRRSAWDGGRYERGLFDPDAAPGDQPVRPLHLRHRLRRRHGRRGDQRGLVAGGYPAARQPDRVLRPQRDLDRGRH